MHPQRLVIFLFPDKKHIRPENELTNTPDKHAPASSDASSPHVSGTGLDGITKQPLAAKVILKNNKQIVQTAGCNASGEYALNLHDAKYLISAEYPGYVPKGRYDISHSIEINNETNKLNKIYLWPEAKIKGRIVSGDSGISSELKFTYQYDDSNAENYKFKTLSMAYRDYTEEDGSRSRSATSIQVDQNGEFITDELPEGEFSIYAFTPTGEASYFSGLQVKFDSDHVMDFDMSYSRKESENGVSLMMPRPTWTDEEFKAMSEEQKREILPKYFASIDRWTEAIQEQERYQQAEAQRISEKAEFDIEAE